MEEPPIPIPVASNPRVPDLVGKLVTDDGELLDYLVQNRVAGYWQRFLAKEGDLDVESLRAEPFEGRARLVRDTFISEHDAAMAMPVPSSYDYHVNGRAEPPLPMQRVIAFRLSRERGLGNWSGVGSGKTVSAVLSALTLNARLTLVVAYNSTLDNWEREIKAVCPSAQVRVKDKGPYSFDPGTPAFVVINYEAFQSWASDPFIREITSGGTPLDFVVIDEIQSVRQRSHAEESDRRKMLNALLKEARARNAELRVLGMSATPVINNLHEARKTLELVTGEDYDHVPTRVTIGNIVAYHRLLTRHGLRLRPNHPVQVRETHVEVDGTSLIPDLSRLGKLHAGKIAELERSLLQAKLGCIGNTVRPGTVIYTLFVTEVVDELKSLVESKGMSVGVHMGEDKSGLDKFRRRLIPGVPPSQRCDVLIGSTTLGTGVDGLQKVADRLIFATLPWTGAEYEQVVGRLRRKGSIYQLVEVFIPQVVLDGPAGVWSWDHYRDRCIRYKRTLADAVVDGVVPAGRIPSREQMYEDSMEDLKDWIERFDTAAATSSPDEAAQDTVDTSGIDVV